MHRLNRRRTARGHRRIAVGTSVSPLWLSLIRCPDIACLAWQIRRVQIVFTGNFSKRKESIPPGACEGGSDLMGSGDVAHRANRSGRYFDLDLVGMAIATGLTPALGRQTATVIVLGFFNQWVAAVGRAEVDTARNYFFAMGAVGWEDRAKRPREIWVTNGTGRTNYVGSARR